MKSNRLGIACCGAFALACLSACSQSSLKSTDEKVAMHWRATSDKLTRYEKAAEATARSLTNAFRNLQAPKKAIITTEKDAMRLELHRDYLAKQKAKPPAPAA